MRGLLAVAILLTAAGPAETLYDFEWRSVATLSRWQAGETVTTRAELAGRGLLRLQPVGRNRQRFTFWSPEGEGHGEIVDTTLQDLVFPTALPIGQPAAPPHLTSGTFHPVGDPRRPAAFELTWAEGFICRTTPVRCGDVAAWARELTGHATRATR